MITIVGAGIAGLSTAYHLVKAGYQDIHILESGEKIMKGTTQALGLCLTKGIIFPNTKRYADILQGQQFLRGFLEDLEKESNRTIRRTHQVFELFRTDEEYAYLRNRIYHGEFTGLHRFKELNRTELLERGVAPPLLEGVEGGFWLYEDSWVCPEDVLSTLREILIKAGVQFHSKKFDPKRWMANSHLPGVKNEEKRWMANSLLPGVKNEEKRWMANSLLPNGLVIAAGAASGELAAELGISIKLKKVYGGWLRCPTSGTNRYVVVKGTDAFISTGNEIWIGTVDFKAKLPTMEFALNTLKEKALKVFGYQVEECELVLGCRALLKSREPLVEYYPEQRVWLNTGYYKNALMLGAFLSGSLACGSINDNE